ncbi:hypothetical protein V6N12_011599 [Hibiscus sabdariffa]|uniref:Uncharacterized protein n=1 Tax=Hibiscus sabdariffa TaxID=183260 RepID=A0ABR2AZI9_9ROSI
MQRHELVPLAKGLQFSWLKRYGTDHSSWQPQASCCSCRYSLYSSFPVKVNILCTMNTSLYGSQFGMPQMLCLWERIIYSTIFKLAILLLIGCHG